MTQTSGILTSQQIELLRTGFQAVSDTVVLTDRTRLPIGAKVGYDPAVIFYWVSVTTNPRVQTDGYTLLHVVQAGAEARLTFPRITPDMHRKLAASLPYRLKQVLVVRAYACDGGGRHHPTATGSPHPHLLDHMAAQQERYAAAHLGVARFLMGRSVRHVSDRLERHGVDRAHVPVALGGDYLHHARFRRWIRTRSSVEEGAVGASAVRNARITHRAVAVQRRRQQEQQQQQQHAQQHQQAEQRQLRIEAEREQIQPSERAMAIPASTRTIKTTKQQRRRRPCPVVDLRRRIQMLESSRIALHADHRRLAVLLAQAKIVVARSDKS